MEKNFVCEVCMKHFVTRKSFQRHYRYLHVEENRNNFVCANCNRALCRKDALLSHIRHCQQQNSKHVCHVCKKTYAYRRSFLRHYRSDHKNVQKRNRPVKSSIFICDICEKSFTHRNSFLRHFRSSHEKDNLDFHACHVCNTQFPHRKSFLCHYRSVHGRSSTKSKPKVFICDACGKKFSYRRTFLRHYRSIHERVFTEGNLPEKSNILECASCHKKFARKDVLVRHIRLCQRINIGSNDTYVCAVCYKSFQQKRLLRVHIGIHLRKNVVVPCPVVGSMKCVFCEDSFSSKYSILDHIMRHHGIQIDHQHMKFTSKSDFEEWRMIMQKSTTTSFRKRNITHSKHWYIIQFICHRSGSYNGKTLDRKKRLKRQGTKKLDAFCPAEITLRINTVDGSCKVSYVSTHLGHNIFDKMELAHIYPTKEERANIALKIAVGISSEKILNDIMSSTQGIETDPLYYLNKHDLCNISRDYKVTQTSKIAPSEDSMNMEAFISKYEKSILYCKRLDEVDGKYETLLPDDIVIVIMTPLQEEMLMKYSDKVIAVDETFSLNRYEFLLRTFLVIDDLHERIPVVFIISNRDDELLVQITLESIRDKIGILCPKTFLSDIQLTHIKTWEKIMGPVKFRLFCSWRVFEDWRKNFKMIQNTDKRECMQKRLYELSMCLDENIFQKLLKELLENRDAELQVFLNYFKIHYSETPESWAYCYRKHALVNTNTHTDVFNRNLKYFRGKLGQKLSLNNCLQLLNTYLNDMERSLKRKRIRGKVSSKLAVLRKIHDAFEKKLNNMEIGVNCTPADEECDEWDICISEVEKDVANVYHVRKCKDNCNSCELYCEKCDACLYMYQCSCPENSVRNNMCEHIHALCTVLKNKNVLIIQETVDVFPQNYELYQDNVKFDINDDEELRTRLDDKVPVNDFEETKCFKTSEEPKCFESSKEPNVECFESSEEPDVKGFESSKSNVELLNVKKERVLNLFLENVNDLRNAEEVDFLYELLKPFNNTGRGHHRISE